MLTLRVLAPHRLGSELPVTFLGTVSEVPEVAGRVALRGGLQALIAIFEGNQPLMMNPYTADQDRVWSAQEARQEARSEQSMDFSKESPAKR